MNFVRYARKNPRRARRGRWDFPEEIPSGGGGKRKFRLHHATGQTGRRLSSSGKYRKRTRGKFLVRWIEYNGEMSPFMEPFSAEMKLAETRAFRDLKKFRFADY